MSYMAGPMTLQQIRGLQETPAPAPAGRQPLPGAHVAVPGDVVAPAAGGPTPSAEPAPPPAPASPSGAGDARPILPPGVPEHFLAPLRGADGLTYEPALGVFLDVGYRHERLGVDETRRVRLLLPFQAGPVPVDWDRAEVVDLEPEDLDDAPVPRSHFAALPPAAGQAKSYAGWGREASRWVQASQPITLFESKSRKAVSRPGESEAEFRLRLADLRREARDAAVDRVRARWEPRVAALQERERRALQAVEKRAGAAQQRTLDAALRVGEGLMGAFLGRKTSAARTGTAIRSAGRVLQQRREVAQAGETVEAIRTQRVQMEEELREELRKVEASFQDEDRLDQVQVRPALAGMAVRLVALLWLPGDASGRALWR
jgi:hypothetical protein